MIKKVDDVPKIELEFEDGKKIALHNLKKTILYFYPKDDTPGCTTEACSFRDYNEDIRKSGWNIYGISKDTLESHDKFTKKYELNFSLLSDADLEAARAFGAFGERSLYGKIFKGVLRTTFAVDSGKVLHVWEGVKPKEHAKEVFEWIKENS